MYARLESILQEGYRTEGSLGTDLSNHTPHRWIKTAGNSGTRRKNLFMGYNKPQLQEIPRRSQKRPLFINRKTRLASEWWSRPRRHRVEPLCQ